jgi:hypothetical protein
MEKHKWHQLLQQAMLVALNTSVQLVLILCLKKYLMAFNILDHGNLHHNLIVQAARASPSLTIPAKSVAITSALTSPSTISQIFL